jgi:hypothetical protein
MLKNIHIKRFAKDPTAQGCIEPEDRSWQLVIDAKGFPHLYVRVKLEEDDGAFSHGMLALDDMLPEGTTVEDIMTGEFGGRLTPKEEAEEHAKYMADIEAGKRPPCPR